MYLRQNVTQKFLGDLRDVSQPTISRIVTDLVPLIKAVLEEFVPSAEDAIEMVKGRACLVDGTITPYWSYADHKELWSRKRGITGFNAQLVSLLNGYPVYISDPLPGCTHDATAFDETPVAEIIRNSGGGIGDKGYQGTDLATPRKTPKKENLASETKKATRPFRHSGRPLNESSLTSNLGGSYTPTTAALTLPTAKPTTPPVACSSSLSAGILNKTHESRRPITSQGGRGTRRCYDSSHL
jgi:hypothetical protein